MNSYGDNDTLARSIYNGDAAIIDLLRIRKVVCVLPVGSNNYNCTFPAMIDDWRDKWHTSTIEQTDPMFGFGFVQVAIDCCTYIN